MNGPVICGIEDANDKEVAAVARELAERFGIARVGLRGDAT